MTDTAALRRALEAVEQATGPSFGLEQELAKQFYPDLPGVVPPNLTASIDEVISLIEREMPGTDCALNWGGGRDHAMAWVGGKVRRHSSPALALLAAFLRAKLHEAEQREDAA